MDNCCATIHAGNDSSENTSISKIREGKGIALVLLYVPGSRLNSQSCKGKRKKPVKINKKLLSENFHVFT